MTLPRKVYFLADAMQAYWSMADVLEQQLPYRNDSLAT